MTIVNGLPATRLMDSDAVDRTIRRLAHEVVEHHKTLEKIVIAAVREGGVPIAQELAASLLHLTHESVRLVQLDVEAFRDDRPRPPEMPQSAIRPLARRPDGTKVDDRRHRDPSYVDLHDATVILVDDVVHTGRTLRAALDLLTSRGRPATVEPLVLVDRGARELPIRPTYVGKNLPVSADEWLEVTREEKLPNTMIFGLCVYAVKRG